MADQDRVVLFDDNCGDGNAHTLVTATVATWPDPRPRLVIDDRLCSAKGNPYWDSDDHTTRLELSASSTSALAQVLGACVDDLPKVVATLVANDERNAISRLLALLDSHALYWRRLRGTAADELGGTMHENASERAPSPDDNQDFAAPGSARDRLIATLVEDLHALESGMVVAAERLARIVHASQRDKAGEPYVGHPQRVAHTIMRDSGPAEAVAAGWLHDVVEDTWVTVDFLAECGFPESVVEAVDAVTKRSDEGTAAYVQRIAANPLAVTVKHADLSDNTTPRRLDALDNDLKARLIAKYREFALILDAAVGDTDGRDGGTRDE